MLRASVSSSKRLVGHRLSCLNTTGRRYQIIPQRNYANEKKLDIKDVPKVQNKLDHAQVTSTTKILNQSIPVVVNSSSTPSNPSRVVLPDSKETHQSVRFVPVRKPRKLFRKFASFLVFFTAIGFSGGVYLSSINDNFHDFFTEYVPFGEQAVLYLEEMEYRKRFPVSSEVGSKEPNSLTSIARHSGVSWRIAEEQKPGSTGRHKDATNIDQNLSRPSSEEKNNSASSSSNEPSTVLLSSTKENSSKTQPILAQNSPVTSDQGKVSELPTSVPFTIPEVDQPSRFPPESNRIDPITMNDGNEPLVQDLVKIINDIIVVVEADNLNAKFISTIEKAKTQLSTVGSRILALKQHAHKEANDKIEAEKRDFDQAAKELIRRVELEMQDQQVGWQEAWQAEREKIQASYDKKLRSELERAKEIYEQRLRNSLLEQAIEMRKKFSQEIQERVEEERNGRLKGLSELSNTVADLEKLATNWNSVVDFNLKTQQLHVAVEATRVFLEKSEKPRPFLRELVALREIASDDPVVNAAIASINPIAYHQGIPSSAQIIDRFRRVATEVRKAALLPTDAGVASHASSYVLSKLLFKKTGIGKRNDVESVLTRAETYLEEGNLDSAAREVNGLKGWAKTLSRDWLDEVRRVLEVRQALDVISTEARLKSLTVGE
ncbi:MICOS complex subunit mic60 [Erysiphe neolycopersici]|uniref:MICOS complex subunit MIC60 n=1 Tax=Erysiphe neolycopersici TaxID=212602 RepID=A0A420HMC7_9PEZI|nr:MICOS complex subunit mic60 [Erysiphe neolycopersici]